MADLTIPDVAHWIEGWRVWRRESGGRLQSLYAGDVWPQRQVARAGCHTATDVLGQIASLYGIENIERCHVSPHEHCHCGIYFKHRPPPWEDVFIGPDRIVGRVAVWGKVIQGTEGGRAQFAYPLSLSDKKLAKLYGVAWEQGYRRRVPQWPWGLRVLFTFSSAAWATIPLWADHMTAFPWFLWWFNQVAHTTMAYLVWKEPPP